MCQQQRRHLWQPPFVPPLVPRYDIAMASHSIQDRLSAAEAAVKLGLSIETVKRQLKSGRLDGHRDNTGKWWVILSGCDMATPDSDKVVPRDGIANAVPEQTPQALTPDPPKLASLNDVRIMLGEQRAYHEADMAALRADHAAERQRHEADLARQDARHLAELTRLERAYQSAADALMAKVSAVMVASRPRRSWWRW